MILKVFICDVCGKEHREESPGYGAPRWGSFQGINLNGVDNPVLCPDCKNPIAQLLSDKAEKNGMG